MGKIETEKFLDPEVLKQFEALQVNKQGYIWRIYALTNRIGPGVGKGNKAKNRAKNKVARRQRAVNRGR